MARVKFAEAALAALRAVFGESFARGFSIALWDGTYVPAVGVERFVLCLNEPGALRAALANPVDLAPGRAFVAGLISVRGDLESALDTFFAASSSLTPLRFLQVARLLRRLPACTHKGLHEVKLRGALHTRARDRAAIGFHYDQPVGFYRAFLGRDLMYSSAYFDDGIEMLDAAQTAKIDYILRKVRLQPGERILDIGCGWGGLVARAASHFGAAATGITLSRAQYEEATGRIEAQGLSGSACIELRDYRDLGDATFDKIVSIGMFEHVGHSKLLDYFKAAFAALRPGGLFLNSGIANQERDRQTGEAAGFIERFIFPDGELVRLSEALSIAEKVGFEIRDVESLREHYMRTLRAWVANLESNQAAAIAATDEQTVRAWRLYMAGSAQGFRVGRLGVFQSLLARPGAGGGVGIPPTRRDLYGPVSTV